MYILKFGSIKSNWALNWLLYPHSAWVIWNLLSYFLWEERTEVLEQLSFLIEKTDKKTKKHPLAKQLCHLLGKGQDSLQFFFVWCSKHRGNCTQRGWDGLGTWFAILIPVAGLDTVSAFSKRDQRMALCALFWCFPHTWHCCMPKRNISIYHISIITVQSLRAWASGKQKATTKGCSAVGTSLSFWQVEVFQPCRSRRLATVLSGR